MKNKTKILLSILIVYAAFNSNAQTDVDALRYSGSSVTGTARFTSMSGAFGALGGDFTTLSYNPAGIAVYRSSELTFSPSIYVNTTSSNFLGKSFSENKYNFNIPNAGIVYTYKLTNNEISPGWKSWNFGFGYSRLDNFHARSYYEGKNPSSSLLDNFAENSNGINYDGLDPFYEYLAYYTYLINPDSLNHYASAFPNGNIIQSRTSESKGATGEMVFSFGGNYSNKLYVGATFGFKSLRYIYYSTYEEFDPEKLADTLDQFHFEENVTTHGWGFDFKAGMIYRANDMVRLGFSVQTPTWYGMHDDYKNFMTSRFDGGSSEYAESPDGEFDYDLTTPFNAMGSLALVFGKYGLISSDYQFSNCGESRFDAPGYTFASVNNTIQNKYGEVHTIRIGTEWLYNNLSLRGGFSLATSPLNKNYRAGTSDFSKKNFSGGIGFREGHLFIDLGYVYSVSDQFYQPYSLMNEEVPGVKSRVSSSNFVATFGVKF